MKVAKKNQGKTTATTDSKSTKEQLRAEYSKMGPLKLRKFAIVALGISADIVDGWNDFNYMVEYCVCKKLGLPLPEEAEDNGEEEYDEGSTFDTAEPAGEEEEDNEPEPEAGESLFANPNEMEDEEDEEEPPPPPKTQKTKSKLEKKKLDKVAPKTSAPGDIESQLGSLLDVITNQGVVIDKLSKAVAGQKSTVEAIYVRQEATHRALTGVAKTVWQVSTYVSEFVPKALKAMRYNSSVTKDVKTKAQAAAKAAEGAIEKLLDPEAE